MHEQFEGVIGIVFIRGSPDKFVLIKNLGTGNITFPAGSRDTEEISSRQTLERELREETGLLPHEYDVIDTHTVHEFVYNDKKKSRAGQKARQPVYLVETKVSDLYPEDPDAIIDGWYTAEEVLNKLTFDDAKELFKNVIKGIKAR